MYVHPKNGNARMSFQQSVRQCSLHHILLSESRHVWLLSWQPCVTGRLLQCVNTLRQIKIKEDWRYADFREAALSLNHTI